MPPKRFWKWNSRMHYNAGRRKSLCIRPSISENRPKELTTHSDYSVWVAIFGNGGSYPKRTRLATACYSAYFIREAKVRLFGLPQCTRCIVARRPSRFAGRCASTALSHPTPLLIAATETSSGEVTPPFVCDTVRPMHHHSIVKFFIPTGCEASDAACDGCMSNSGPTLQIDLRWT